tara:strand:+ start:244 stop:471 length:228 start_codon:yes stop_codon:yes gene_type:complete
MKNIKEIKKSEGSLNTSEIEDLKWIMGELDNIIKSNKINENNMLKLENILTTFINLKRVYGLRFIKLLKQNHMLD